MGRLQPRVAWDHRIYNARELGELPPRLQPETPMPPDQVACLPDAAGIFHHGLSVRCVPRKGLTTYWTVPYLRQGQVVVRNKYGGYRNKTRSTVDSGGLCFLQGLAQQSIPSTVSPGQGHNPCLLPHISHDTTMSNMARAHQHVQNRSTLLGTHNSCMSIP